MAPAIALDPEPRLAGAPAQCWLTWKQATSYWLTAWAFDGVRVLAPDPA